MLIKDRNDTVNISRGFNVAPYGLALIAVALATGIGELLWPWGGLSNIDLVFLTAVVATAVRFGLGPSIFASIVSALSYNFFFTDPYHTFVIADPTNVIAVLFFAVVAVVVSNLAARARAQAIVAEDRARTTESLYAFSGKLAGIGTLDDLLWATAHQIASMLQVRVVILLPEKGTVALKAGYPPIDALAESDIAAAMWTWEHSRVAGRDADILPGAKRLFVPMRTSQGAVGVVGVDKDEPGMMLTPNERRLLDALVDQSAVAVERVHLVEDMERVKLTVETERLRSALLTSISHDLKTPLAAVLASAGALRTMSKQLTEPQKADLLDTVVEESERLNRFIANLLDMTRLESGAMTPNAARHDLNEIIGSTLRRAEKVLDQHRVELQVSRDLPMLDLDPILIEQALFNLLDNAAKYAATGTAICIRSWRDDDEVVLQVLDEGVGIPTADLDRIFDKFYRARKGDHVRAGTGLGLPVARGFLEASNGTLTAANRSDRRGAIFTVRLPIPPERPLLDVEQ